MIRLPGPEGAGGDLLDARKRASTTDVEPHVHSAAASALDRVRTDQAHTTPAPRQR